MSGMRRRAFDELIDFLKDIPKISELRTFRGSIYRAQWFTYQILDAAWQNFMKRNAIIPIFVKKTAFFRKQRASCIYWTYRVVPTWAIPGLFYSDVIQIICSNLIKLVLCEKFVFTLNLCTFRSDFFANITSSNGMFFIASWLSGKIPLCKKNRKLQIIFPKKDNLLIFSEKKTIF